VRSAWAAGVATTAVSSSADRPARMSLLIRFPSSWWSEG
jgi:hypothetical protein